MEWDNSYLAVTERLLTTSRKETLGVSAIKLQATLCAEGRRQGPVEHEVMAWALTRIHLPNSFT